MKVVTIVGARPQFIKAAPVCNALKQNGIREILVHTGQHYDYGMSQVFFKELGLPEPDVNLGVGSGSHGLQTGKMLINIEEVLLREKPDWVLVYGDTNSTIAGAMAACKLRIPVIHVEAGLRSFNRSMPEEHNRVLTDHCSDLLFCPTQSAVKNLENEGVTKGVHLVGDTMYDAVLHFSNIANKRSNILKDLNLIEKGYLLATVHRNYNTDIHENLRNILTAFVNIGEPVIFPVHPRTRKQIAELNGMFDFSSSNVKIIDPVSYLDMLVLEQNAKVILTDSGGMQKEAYFFRVPCVTLRPETEWLETVDAGWNRVVGADRERIFDAVKNVNIPNQQPDLFGTGDTAFRIAAIMSEKRI